MENKEFATKYQKAKIGDNTYILIPLEVIEGYSMNDNFYNVDIYETPSVHNIESADILVDRVVTIDDILSKYDYEDLGEDFLVEYYTAEEKDKIIIVEIKKGELIKKTIPLSAFRENSAVHGFEMSQNGPSIYLNETLVNRLLSSCSLPELRKELLRIKDQLSKFKEQNEQYGTTRIIIKDGKVVEMEDNGELKIIPEPKVATQSSQVDTPSKSDFSRKGLLNYLRERIYGHDDELEVIATVIARNLRPEVKKEDIESILIAGPTGSGKTVTFEAVGEYFDVPFRPINTPALVPEGIVGKSIDDFINSIINECNGNIARAQRSIILFDEFDKISGTGLDVKKSVIDELYKFMEGAKITIKKGNHMNSQLLEFDTGFTTRIYSGVFEEAFAVRNVAGFGSKREESHFNLENLFNNSAFSKELMDRIQYKLLYQELSRENKKKAMLSKIGILYKKRDMLKRLYGVDLVIEDDFLDAFLDSLSSKDKSMRDANNLISKMIVTPEGIIADEIGTYKQLILTRDTVSDSKQFTLN